MPVSHKTMDDYFPDPKLSYWPTERWYVVLEAKPEKRMFILNNGEVIWATHRELLEYFQSPFRRNETYCGEFTKGVAKVLAHRKWPVYEDPLSAVVYNETAIAVQATRAWPDWFYWLAIAGFLIWAGWDIRW